MYNFLTFILALVTIFLIVLVLLQPDKSQTTAKNMSSLTQEKEGIEKLTEYTAVIYILLAILIMVLGSLQ